MLAFDLINIFVLLFLFLEPCTYSFSIDVSPLLIIWVSPT